MLHPWRSPLRALFAFLVLTAALAATAFAQPTHVLLVLDASGSMYLKLDDGQYRIAAAKDALSEFVTRLPESPDLNVGLRVYGANLVAVEEGACEDSELVVTVPGFDRAALLRSIRATQAKGATPIAYSLELAAEDLREAEGRKVIVLVTDGAESCGGDVRAAVERLAAEGFEVDVRIIGFALSEFAIASFEGLGTFENATSAAELAAALGRAVDVGPVSAAYPVTVTLTRRGEPAVEGATVRFVDAVGGDTYDLAAGPVGTFAAALPAGSYRAEVTDAYAEAPLVVGGLPILPDAENAFAFELEPASGVALAVEPAEPVAGSSVTVRYEGAPAGERHWITVVPSEAGDDLFLAWSYVDAGAGEVVLRIPDEATELEARFHLTLPEGGTRVIGRSAPFASLEVSASLDAPADVAAGAAFAVGWTGPDNAGDYVTVVAAGAPEGAWMSYAYTSRGSPANLTAPAEPGAYEVRYVTGQASATLASVPVTVTAVTASVAAPAEVGAGADFAVDWRGPDNASDYVTIVPADAGEGEYLSWAYTSRGNPAGLTAPGEPGDYEVRYVMGQDDRTLARAPIRVTEVEASVSAPGEVAAGARFEVVWQGPNASRDYVTIVPVGAGEGEYLSWAYTSRGSPATLTAPEEPGAYEVRYVLGTGDRTLARAAINVR